ncbi:hypothetical protein FOL47_006194 [Perkinsus chesapeaki]|uniref:Uncharacterized protein n=1 Tax=Perkinsus chesapeaki TaxID=330153 RepID=A0A7J6LTG3_PERCH|nr:hypothetical protein FOL47_006194 [Perkinsus chesapeaki]
MVVEVPKERRLPSTREIEDDIVLDRTFFQKLVKPSTTDSDWDIYLVESLWPVLAKGLAALALEVEKLHFRDDADPLVRSRFCPLAWLAQYLLRNNPSSGRIGDANVEQFSEWAELERGRREIYRRKKEIRGVFEGFCSRRQVRISAIHKVVAVLDELAWLGGELINCKYCSTPKILEAFAGKDSIDFDEFWHWFAGPATGPGGVPLKWTAFVRAQARKHHKETQEREAAATEEKEAAAVEAMRADEEREKHDFVTLNELALLARFAHLCTHLLENKEIQRILDEDYILTGMEPDDESEVVDEVPPKGAHVELICDLLEKAGFRKDPKRFCRDDIAPELAALNGYQISAPEDVRWTVICMHQWALLQRLLVCECEDGIVDSESLELVMNPEEFAILRRKVALTKDVHLRSTSEELPDLTGTGFQDEGDGSGKCLNGAFLEQAAWSVIECAALEHVPGGAPSRQGKPSMKELSDRYNINIIRLEWLLEQFGTLLPEGQDNYPDDPQVARLKVICTMIHS